MSLGVENPLLEVQFLVWSGMLAHYVSCFTLNNKVTPFNPGSLENVVLLNCITPKLYAKDTMIGTVWAKNEWKPILRALQASMNLQLIIYRDTKTLNWQFSGCQS